MSGFFFDSLCGSAVRSFIASCVKIEDCLKFSRIIICCVALVVTGCASPKFVGGVVETYGDMAIAPSDEYVHVGTATCKEIEGIAACGRAGFDYTSEVFVKRGDGMVESMLLIISEKTTGSSTFMYDRGRYFNHSGQRHVSFDWIADTERKEDDWFSNYFVFLEERGWKSQPGEHFATAMRRRVDSRHMVSVVMVQPRALLSAKATAENMSEASLQELLRSVEIK